MSQFKSKKKTIVFDLDGTLSDFERIDHEIIEKLFPNFKLVKFVDKIAWFVNKKDVLKNTMPILILRLGFYAVMSGKNVKKVLNMYRQEYFFKTYDAISKIYQQLLPLYNKYRIRIISNNKYSKGIQYKKAKVKYMSSKLKFVNCLKKNNHDIIYVVGNNLCDDVLTAKLSNNKSIYIGKNKFIKFISNEKFDNINDVINFLNNL